MVIAPCSPEAIQDAAFRLARKHSIVTKRDYLRETDWKTALGTGHGGLYTRVPGSEGGDRNIAEIVSRDLGDVPVYTVWFDVELESIVEFRRGKVVAEIEDDSVKFARGLGFELDFPELPPWQPRAARDVIVVEGATIDDLRSALGAERIDERALKIEAVPIGAIVHRDGGRLVGEAGDLVGALLTRTIYVVTRDDDGLEVSVMRGDPEYFASFRDPRTADSLSDILGAHTPATILAALGIAPSLLGYP